MASKFEGEIEKLEKKLIDTEKSLKKIKNSKFSKLDYLKAKLPQAYQPRDMIQQIIGASIAVTPFILTDEVWALAAYSSWFKIGLRIVIFLLLSILILYYSNYREFKRESILGIPYRILSLVGVSFVISITILSLLDIVSFSQVNYLKLVLFILPFAMVGAATADVIK